MPAREYPLALRVTDSHGDTSTGTTSVRFVADFDLVLGGGTMTIVPGQSDRFAWTVIGSRGFGEPVTLSVSGLPAGVGAASARTR